MNKNNKFPLIVVSLLVLVLSLGAMAIAPSPIADPGEGFGPGGRGGRGGGSRNNENLAEALGITSEELQSAFEEARSNAGPDAEFEDALAAALGISLAALESAQDAALAQSLADGDITQEQYDQIVARQAVQEYLDRDEMVADALGLTVAELQAAQEAGQRMPDLLEELGIDQETFQANVQASQETAFAQAVADGVITQEQADQFQEGGFGGRGGPRDGGKGGRGPGGQDGPGGQGPGNQGGPGQGGPGQGGPGQGGQGIPGGNNG